MKYLGIYIKDRKMYFFLTAFICGVTAVINYLYSAPLQAGIYAFKISLTVLVIVCAADYVHFYKKHENLQRHCHLKEVHALEEDAAHTAIERDTGKSAAGRTHAEETDRYDGLLCHLGASD